MSLDGDPRLQVSANARTEIIKHLWRRRTVARLQPEDLHWDSYFAYYTTECNFAIECGEGKYASVRTHADIISIAGQLQEHHTKKAIKQQLRQTLQKPRPLNEVNEMLEGSVTLAARLVTMVDIGPRPHVPEQQPSLNWDDDSLCLKEVLAKRFTGYPVRNQEDTGFEENFTAYNLRRLAGIKIEWIDNLAHHLHLSRDRKRLRIFHHASFLKSQESDIFPDGLAEETLRTLALLFPPHDPKTQRWISSICSSSRAPICLDLQLVECDRVRECQVNDFKFWHEKLLALQKIFDGPHQTSIFQQWHDKRNITQWYTFWIAVVVLCLTIFFGLVQTIEGAIQVYKAYHPTTN